MGVLRKKYQSGGVGGLHQYYGPLDYNRLVNKLIPVGSGPASDTFSRQHSGDRGPKKLWAAELPLLPCIYIRPPHPPQPISCIPGRVIMNLCAAGTISPSLLCSKGGGAVKEFTLCIGQCNGD